ncbi:MAG: hypothetical protein IJU58_00670 [Clostridia bacterium]|nr:hypothetical protein [Clostridia bacterium]
MADINNDNVKPSQQTRQPQNLPKQLPKKLPSQVAKAPNAQQQPASAQPAPQPQPKEKSIDELLSRTSSYSYTTPQEPVMIDRVIHKNDKQIIKEYIAKVKSGKAAIKKVKQEMLFTDQHYKRVENVFADGIPETLWFFEHRKMRALINKFDAALTLSAGPSHRGFIIALILVLLIIAIIASGIYIAFLLTRNLNPNDTTVEGDIVFNWEDTQSGMGLTTTSLNINQARLNKDIEVSPAVTNNTNTDLYLRFFVKLDYLLGKDYWGVNIEDLSVSCNVDNEKWWLDSSANVAYYLLVLHPNEKIFVFDSFQINGDPSIEGAWSGRSVGATIQVEVCQKLGEDQELPPGWSNDWYAMMSA